MTLEPPLPSSTNFKKESVIITKTMGISSSAGCTDWEILSPKHIHVHVVFLIPDVKAAMPTRFDPFHTLKYRNTCTYYTKL